MTPRGNPPALLETVAGVVLLLGVGLLVAGTVMLFGGVAGVTYTVVVGVVVCLVGTALLVRSDLRRRVTR